MTEPPFLCPYCDQVLQLADNVWYYTCDTCHNRLDLKSQFAYLRGLDAFKEGQDMMENINPKKLRYRNNPQENAAMSLFMEAYSSMQVAFLAELEENQRSLGVEMMTSMAQEFMKRGMISQTELMYWNTLMIEQTAQNEFDQLNQKIANAKGFWGKIKKYRWTGRQNKILKTITDLDRKFSILERQIEFTDPPRARNRKWKPTVLES